MTMKVTVTQEDIDKGIRCNARACPIANAIMKKKNIVYVSVLGNTSVKREINKRSLHYIYKLPTSAKSFIKAFDSCEPVEPFTFEMRKRK